jgi:hypothetical protein
VPIVANSIIQLHVNNSVTLTPERISSNEMVAVSVAWGEDIEQGSVTPPKNVENATAVTINPFVPNEIHPQILPKHRL